MQSLKTAEEALLVLQSPGSLPAHRKSAEEWLLSFQLSHESWQASVEALLQSVPETTTAGLALFLSQSLRKKCQCQLHTISREHWPALCDSFLTCAARQAGSSRAVLQQLCLALAHLTYQCTEWTDAIKTTTQRLPLQAALVYLTALPEEFHEAEQPSSGDFPPRCHASALRRERSQK